MSGDPYSERLLAALEKFIETLEEGGNLEFENLTIEAEELKSEYSQPRPAKPLPTAGEVVEEAPKELPLPETEVEVPADTYKGRVKEVEIGATPSDGGTRGETLVVGGDEYPPLYLFEGENVNEPVTGLDIFDQEIDMPGPVRELYGDAIQDPVSWAEKAAKEFEPDFLNLNLFSVDPQGRDEDPRDAAKVVEDVLEAVDLPLMIGGSGSEEKDPELLARVAEIAEGERVLLNNAQLDHDYAAIAEAATEHGHPVVALTFNNISDVKELNAKLKGEGVEDLVVDPLTAPLGTGIEWTLSFMKRIRFSALFGDGDYQFPVIAAASNSQGAREAHVKSVEGEDWGPRRYRNSLWEATTVAVLLLSGVNLFLAFNPAAHAVAKDIIEQVHGAEGDPVPGDWIELGVR